MKLTSYYSYIFKAIEETCLWAWCTLAAYPSKWLIDFRNDSIYLSLNGFPDTLLRFYISQNFKVKLPISKFNDDRGFS